jgi:hypothetical protein
MADTTLIQEFLAQLHFKVDEASLQKFAQGLQKGATQAVAFGVGWEKLGEQAVKAAEAVVKAVIDMTAQLDTLYFASRRIGDSVSNIQAFGFAMSQMGEDAKTAQANLKAFAISVQENPALLTFLQAQGVQIRDAHGNIRPPSELMTAGAAALNAQMVAAHGNLYQLAMIHQRAEMLGISWEEVQADPKQRAAAVAEHARNERLLGVNTAKTSAASVRFQNDMKRLGDVFSVMIEALTDKVLPVMSDFIEFLLAIPQGIEKIGEVLGGVIRFIADLVTGNWSKAWKDIADTATTAFQLIAKAVEKVLILALRFQALVTLNPSLNAYADQLQAQMDAAIAKVGGGAAAGAGAGAGAVPVPPPKPPPPKPAAPAGAGVADVAGGLVAGLGGLADAAGGLASGIVSSVRGAAPHVRRGITHALPPTPPAGGPAGVVPSVTGATRTARGQQVVAFLRSLGLSEAAAIGAASVLGAESIGWNPNAAPPARFHVTARGLAQWMQNRRDEYTKATGKTVGSDMASQLAFMGWELHNTGKKGYANVLNALMHAKTVAEAQDIWLRLYEGITPTQHIKGRAIGEDYWRDVKALPKYLALLSPGMAGQGLVLNQTVNVNGVTDANAAGRQVVLQTRGAVQNIQRDFGTKVS